MKQLRTLHTIVLLAAIATTPAQAADQTHAAAAMRQTSIIVLPQVVVVGKRLSLVEKNRLAQTRLHAHAVRPAVKVDHKS